jgi:hypothetical protein
MVRDAPAPAQPALNGERSLRLRCLRIISELGDAPPTPGLETGSRWPEGHRKQLEMPGPAPPTHTNTGGPHVSRIWYVVYLQPLALQLGQKPLTVRGGLLVVLPAESVLVSTTTTGWTSRGP